MPCHPAAQANATVNGPIMVFLVPVGEGSAASPPPRLPLPLPGLPGVLPAGQPAVGEVPVPGLPELHPPADGDGEHGRSYPGLWWHCIGNTAAGCRQSCSLSAVSPAWSCLSFARCSVLQRQLWRRRSGRPRPGAVPCGPHWHVQGGPAWPKERQGAWHERHAEQMPWAANHPHPALSCTEGAGVGECAQREGASGSHPGTDFVGVNKNKSGGGGGGERSLLPRHSSSPSVLLIVVLCCRGRHCMHAAHVCSILWKDWARASR